MTDQLKIRMFLLLFYISANIISYMLLRIENPFMQLANKLRNPFSEEEKVKLARALESSYDKVRSVMLAQEAAKDQSKPTVIKLGNVGTRFFILNIYYNDDEMYDDIPMSIRQILPSISPVRIDVMATISKASADLQENYVKAAQAYDDGDIHAHFFKEVVEEDEGIRPVDDKVE